MKNGGFLESLANAFQGVRHALARERNFRIHIICGILAVAACIVFRVETYLFVWVVFAIFCVLIAELINSAIEALTDLISESKHPLAKIAKDTAAAAVLLAAAQALVAALIVAVSVIGR